MFHKTLYGQVRAIKLGLAAHLGIHPDSTAARLMPWITSHAVFTINRYLIRQDGKTSYERVFSKAHSGPLVHFGERVLAHHQATPPPQKLHLRSQPQKHYSLWLGKFVITGMHIVAHEGQALKTRTVTRLVKDQQFNPVEFNKIILPPHESEPHYQEPHEDRVALQELLRSFIMQQQSLWFKRSYFLERFLLFGSVPIWASVFARKPGKSTDFRPFWTEMLALLCSLVVVWAGRFASVGHLCTGLAGFWLFSLTFPADAHTLVGTVCCCWLPAFGCVLVLCFT